MLPDKQCLVSENILLALIDWHRRARRRRPRQRSSSSSSSSTTTMIDQEECDPFSRIAHLHQLPLSPSSCQSPSSSSTHRYTPTSLSPGFSLSLFVFLSSPLHLLLSYSLPCDSSQYSFYSSPTKSLRKCCRNSFHSPPRKYCKLICFLSLLALASSSPASQASFSLPSPIDYYEKPSEFFNRYFTCRYEIEPSKEESGQDDNHYNSSEESEEDNRARQPKQACAIDCDGVSKWPETKPGSRHSIPCLEVVAAIKRPTFRLNLDGEFPAGISPTYQSSAGSVLQDESEKMAGDDPSALLRHIPQEDKLRSSRAYRKCNTDGEWQGAGDYSGCGLNATRLFVLNREQLNTIYRIRESYVFARFEKNAKTEAEFIKCVDTVLSLPPSKSSKPQCERTFDGWSCFNDTDAGDVVDVKCPEVYGFNPLNKAKKTCTEEGKWRTHPTNGLKPWTNYTSCVDVGDLAFRSIIIRINIIGYSISLVALLISLTIFWSFKALSSQTRIRIHKNCFVSFIVNNTMWIAWFFTITTPNILDENSLFCQSLHVLLHYFLVCNYFWMFCEGLYLHTILVVAFVSEGRILKWFYLIGWCIPAIFVTAYALMRAHSHEAKNCWIEDSKYAWIYNGPIVISFVLNTIFLINIVRVLVTKLQAVNTADAHHTRKAVRATLILLPLLGLHFIVTPFRPETNNSASRAYEIFSASVSSLQGFAVAMLFCFFNGEVLNQLKKRWAQFLLLHGYNSNRRMSYGHTVSVRLSNCNLNMHRDSVDNNNHSASKNGHVLSHEELKKLNSLSHESDGKNELPVQHKLPLNDFEPLAYEHLTQTEPEDKHT